MAVQLFRIMGRFTGYVLRSHVIDRAVTKTANYVFSEMRLADIRMRLILLRQKRNHHLSLLGKTFYRLSINNIDPLQDEHTRTISRVLSEIDTEIEQVNAELERRKQSEKQREK